jgi:hypothetical protein
MMKFKVNVLNKMVVMNTTMSRSTVKTIGVIGKTTFN